jgi:hypothetical protein
VDDFASHQQAQQAPSTVSAPDQGSGIAGNRRPATKRVRRASVALALSRLEREHVALLLAICELETPNPTDPAAEALREALLPMLRADLRQAQHALSRAARGLYGTCEDCHKPIAARQLELAPASTHCATCQGRDRRVSRALKD